MRNRHENGIALITALLVLLLISSIMIGLTWMVMTDARLGGNNADRQNAFYASEAGMESLTAGLANDFNANYDLSAADINNLMTTPPDTLSGVQYLDVAGGNGYKILFTPDPANGGNPLAANGTILSGPYAGLTGLTTSYTLEVTARTAQGAEAKLERVVQTVAIPVFQFGVFSDTDLSFFAGPNFNFGGRVHTNGNLWLAEGTGSTLTLSDKVTSAGEIIRTDLENGQPLDPTSHGGTVSITTNPGSGNFASLTETQGSTTGNASVNTTFKGGLGGNLNEPTFGNIASATYNHNIGVRETGVTPLNLGIATPALGGQPIDLIRLPVPGEDGSNPAKLAERYYSQASLRILLADYGPSGGCNDSDINNLPWPSPNLTGPYDLANLSNTATFPAFYKNAAADFPLPTSDALSGFGYTANPAPTGGKGGNKDPNASDGYWLQSGKPIITGCIKIDYQTAGVNNPPQFVDVTGEVLGKGLTGRNLYPDWNANPANTTPLVWPLRPFLPGTTPNAGTATGQEPPKPLGCTDPSLNAVIRLARVRDNPSNATSGGCGGGTTIGTDYWPNVLFDTREALMRNNSTPGAEQPISPGGQLTLAGAMSYVELDVNQLAAYITAKGGINNITGYTVYFSDRRGDRVDPTPPPSVGAANMKTGAYGYDDFVNSGDATNGCPSKLLEQGEDVEGDYVSGADSNPILRTYGEALPTTNGGVAATANNKFWYVSGADPSLPSVLTGNALAAPTNQTTKTTVFALNPQCNTTINQTTGTTSVWPGAVAQDARDLRENPPVFFRRALKLVNGSSINLGVCDGVNCGLTIVSENPVYIQGDYNTLNTAFTGAHVAAGVIADAVTFLSDNWNDVNSFAFPYNTGNRLAAQTAYRLAIAAGKGIPFLYPGAPNVTDFGTDGGMHNFLRYLENWGGQKSFYHGSIVSFFYNHQAVGAYNDQGPVYSPPTRGYNFDVEFLTPSLLPPKTPMLRSINTVGFTPMLLPTQ